MKFLSIRNRFYLLTAAIVATLVTVFVLASLAVAPVEESWKEYGEQVAVREALLLEIKGELGYGGLIHNFKNFVLRGAEKHADAVKASHTKLVEAIEAYRALRGLEQAEQSALSEVERVAGLYLEQLGHVVDMVAAGEPIQVIDSSVKIDDQPALAAFEVMNDTYHRLTEATTTTLSDHVKSVDRILLLVLVGALVILIGSILLLGRSILSPLDRLRSTMEQIGHDSDLTREVASLGENEFGAVARALNGMLAKFRDIIDAANASGVQLTSEVDRLTATAEQANQGMQRQQSEIHQVVTAMNEMAATVQEVARNTSAAADAAHDAQNAATGGREVVGLTTDAIDRVAREVERAAEVINKLEQDSGNIGTILDTINGIAEQTNLLALNAAIEAARAGEQGRGFAVVADEVRTLASRTQRSTEEIQDLITQLQSGAREAVQVMDSGRKEAQSSVQQAAAAGESLVRITESVESINEMNAQIASATEEQTSVVEEMNRNIISINEVAEVTAAGAQDNASVAGSMVALVERLRAVVAQFKTGT